jgi:hypothetical protein
MSQDLAAPWSKSWSDFMTKVDTIAGRKEEIHRYVQLICTVIDTRVLVRNHLELSKLAQILLDKGLVTRETHQALLANPIRNFSRFAFPYMNCNSEVMSEIVSSRDRIAQDSAGLPDMARNVIARQMQLICEARMHEGIPRALTQEHFDLFHSVIKSVLVKKLSTEVVPTACDETRSKLVKYGDIGDVLNDTVLCKNTLCHVFASPKCLGGGVPSNGILLGGQEEGVFAKNPLLLVIGVCLFGTPRWAGEASGKIEWIPDYLTALTSGSTIYFPMNEDKVSWVAFYAAPDYRDSSTVPTDQDQIGYYLRAVSNLVSISDSLGTTLVTGEFGTGIYKGSLTALHAVFILMKANRICICAYGKIWDTTEIIPLATMISALSLQV